MFGVPGLPCGPRGPSDDSLSPQLLPYSRPNPKMAQPSNLQSLGAPGLIRQGRACPSQLTRGPHRWGLIVGASSLGSSSLTVGSLTIDVLTADSLTVDDLTVDSLTVDDLTVDSLTVDH
eukprot:360627-Chlamydomonas_euryale.AAC.6